MPRYLVSDTITEFRSYLVEAESEEAAKALVDRYAEDDPNGSDKLEFVDRGITDRFQQIEATK